jgi:outer membrane protein assembly factor BamE
MNNSAPDAALRRTRPAILRTLVVLGCVFLTACVYRLNIQQGNIADAESVSQVEIGMTPSQVKFLLGTPLVDDPFNSDRWDYIYYSRTGRNSPVLRHFLTVYFENGAVSGVETRDEAPGS